ncbi:MAG: hypothetical protein KJ600_00595 [Nanoarchaeota archaeon]|nr:hypothetical protein [Nanoarchaeota archaeon]MBU1103041.1 hypothetical protein [Nanoarchaeota archaeon]
MFTKTQIKVMEIFVSEINKKFSIRQISQIIEKPYPLVHRSIKLLISNHFLTKDENNLISLNYKENNAEIAYIESQRKRGFLEKNKTINLFTIDALKKINLDFFILIIFGSSIKLKNPSDIDVLFIIDNKDRINEFEKLLNNLASNFSKKFDIKVISIESAYEMLAKRDDINVMNETLNKHIILFGAENYYRILKNVR